MALVYYQTTTSFICGGQYAAIVNHWRADDAGLTGNPFLDAENLIASLVDNSAGAGPPWVVLLANLLADDCFVSGVRARLVSGAGGPTAVRIFAPADHPGLFGGDMEAFQTAATVNWACDSADAFRGSNRIPGVSSDALVNNRFTATYQAEVVNFVDNVLLDFQESATAWELIVRGEAGGVPLYRDVIGGYLSPTPGHIKSRRVPV